jgi:hypothetical protein
LRFLERWLEKKKVFKELYQNPCYIIAWSFHFSCVWFCHLVNPKLALGWHALETFFFNFFSFTMPLCIYIVSFRFQIKVLKGLIYVSFAFIYQINLELNQTWYSSVLAWILSKYQISDHLEVVWFRVSFFGSKGVCYVR